MSAKLLVLVLAMAGTLFHTAAAGQVKLNCFYGADDSTCSSGREEMNCTTVRDATSVPTGYEVTGDCADGCFTVTFAGTVPDCEADEKPGTTCNPGQGGTYHFTQKVDCTSSSASVGASAHAALVFFGAVALQLLL